MTTFLNSPNIVEHHLISKVLLDLKVKTIIEYYLLVALVNQQNCVASKTSKLYSLFSRSLPPLLAHLLFSPTALF